MNDGDIHPFEGRLVRPEWAERVVSPPYDALTAAERQEYAAANPDTFLHVTRSSEDVEADQTTGPTELARRSRRAVERLVTIGAYRDVPTAVYLYRLRTDTHEQTGIVVNVDLDAFESGRVRGHEATRPPRAEALAHHLDVCGSMSSPVSLMYRADTVLSNAVERWRTSEPVLDFVSHGRLAQSIWRVDDAAALDLVNSRLNGRMLYITDGHHRAAGASLVRQWRAARGESRAPDRVLCVLFNELDLHAIGFHRIVRGPIDAEAVEAALADRFDLIALSNPPDGAPPRGAFLAWLGGRWYEVVPREWPTDEGVGGLDVTVLHRALLEGVLGVSAADPRLDFVSGQMPISDVAAMVANEGGAVFSAAPPTLGQVSEVANRGEIMPPKSTYFEPKPRSGVFLHLDPDV